MECIITLLILLAVFALFLLFLSFFFAEEIKATKEKDPAARGYLQIILIYSGLHAIMAHRLAHGLWNMKLTFLARLISQISRFCSGIEIHPGAQIGKGLFIDHGMGVVIGETTIIGNDVTLFQGVTLGGTGKETGKRHPTLRNNIVVGAGAKVLGNIEIGSNSYIGANAVVLKDVPENSTIVGVPGRVTKQDGQRIDMMMDHVQVIDPLIQQLNDLQKRIENMEKKGK